VLEEGPSAPHKVNVGPTKTPPLGDFNRVFTDVALEVRIPDEVR
jgi:hypothetical protein